MLNSLKSLTYSRFSNYTLSVIPLFLLMGDLAGRGGLSAALYRAGRAWFGHWRGGLAIATIGGCAAFGAICGSSLATAATMSQVALPEMRKLGYSPALSTGTLAAGGTLGILIPPSIILVIYAVYTEQSIGALFIAAIIPGLIATVQYMLVVNAYVRLHPDSAPRLPKASWARALAHHRGRVARGAGVPAGGVRHLPRLVLADGGGRHRRRGGRRARGGARRHALEGLLRIAARHRARPPR